MAAYIKVGTRDGAFTFYIGLCHVVFSWMRGSLYKNVCDDCMRGSIVRGIDRLYFCKLSDMRNILFT